MDDLSTPGEYRKTESPLMYQLEQMGWTVEDGDTDVPYLSGDRNSFRDVILRLTSSL